MFTNSGGTLIFVDALVFSSDALLPGRSRGQRPPGLCFYVFSHHFLPGCFRIFSGVGAVPRSGQQTRRMGAAAPPPGNTHHGLGVATLWLVLVHQHVSLLNIKKPHRFLGRGRPAPNVFTNSGGTVLFVDAPSVVL